MRASVKFFSASQGVGVTSAGRDGEGSVFMRIQQLLHGIVMALLVGSTSVDLAG